MKHYYIFPFSANMGWDKAYNLKQRRSTLDMSLTRQVFFPLADI